MRSEDDIRAVFELWNRGVPKKAIARRTGASHTQVRRWIAQGPDAVLTSPMRPRRRHDETSDVTKCGLVLNVDEPSTGFLTRFFAA